MPTRRPRHGPPSCGQETGCGRDGFAREDFARMAKNLRGFEGRFILSLDDRPEVRETFVYFGSRTMPIHTLRKVAGGGCRLARLVVRAVISAPADELQQFNGV